MSDLPDNEADQRQAIIDSLYAGQKIQAIKFYRESSGKSLKESKEFVERLETELRRENPEAFKNASGTGCGVSSAVFFLVLLTAITCGILLT